MASSHAEIFGSMRNQVLDTLVENRQSIDDTFDVHSETLLRTRFQLVLDQMHKYLISPSPAHLSQSVAKWTAMLLGLGLSPHSILRAIVTIGDLIVQTAKQSRPPGPPTNLFVRDIVRLNFNITREVVAIFNDELGAQRMETLRGPLGS